MIDFPEHTINPPEPPDSIICSWCGGTTADYGMTEASCLCEPDGGPSNQGDVTDPIASEEFESLARSNGDTFDWRPVVRTDGERTVVGDLRCPRVLREFASEWQAWSYVDAYNGYRRLGADVGIARKLADDRLRDLIISKEDVR